MTLPQVTLGLKLLIATFILLHANALPINYLNLNIGASTSNAPPHVVVDVEPAPSAWTIDTRDATESPAIPSVGSSPVSLHVAPTKNPSAKESQAPASHTSQSETNPSPARSVLQHIRRQAESPQATESHGPPAETSSEMVEFTWEQVGLVIGIFTTFCAVLAIFVPICIFRRGRKQSELDKFGSALETQKKRLDEFETKWARLEAQNERQDGQYEVVLSREAEHDLIYEAGLVHGAQTQTVEPQSRSLWRRVLSPSGQTRPGLRAPNIPLATLRLSDSLPYRRAREI